MPVNGQLIILYNSLYDASYHHIKMVFNFKTLNFLGVIIDHNMNVYAHIHYY